MSSKIQLFPACLSKVEGKSKVNIAKNLCNEKIAAENLPEKNSHKIGEGCSLFSIQTWLYFLYIFLSIVLAVFGTLLTIINWPWPKVEVEDQDYHAMALEFLQITCWICGFLFWLFALFLVYVVYVYHKRMNQKQQKEMKQFKRILTQRSDLIF